MSTIYAGLDADLRVKLWSSDDGVTTKPVTVEDWVHVLDAIGAKPGEMLVVTLSRADNVAT